MTEWKGHRQPVWVSVCVCPPCRYRSVSPLAEALGQRILLRTRTQKEQVAGAGAGMYVSGELCPQRHWQRIEIGHIFRRELQIVTAKRRAARAAFALPTLRRPKGINSG